MAAGMSLCAVLLASGHGKRFSSDKLLYEYGGKPMAERVFSAVPREMFSEVLAVARSEKLLTLAKAYGFTPVPNSDTTDSVAITIKLGVEGLPPDAVGCMFLVCDQPNLKSESIRRLAGAFLDAPDRIWALSFGGKRGNPVIFPRELFGELRSLPFDTGGSAVIRRHSGLLSLLEAGSGSELVDFDVPPQNPEKA